MSPPPLTQGLSSAVKPIKLLEPASSLFSSVDYSVSMVTWLLFLLQSANQRLKMGSRSIAPLGCLHPSVCFISIHPAGNLQLCTSVSSNHFTVTRHQCRRCRGSDCPTISATEVSIWSLQLPQETICVHVPRDPEQTHPETLTVS